VSVGDKATALKAGDTVVYSKFGIGVTDLQIKGEEYAVLKEEDIIGTFPSSGAPTCTAGGPGWPSLTAGAAAPFA
jgi:chaperonin GroES